MHGMFIKYLPCGNYGNDSPDIILYLLRTCVPACLISYIHTKLESKSGIYHHHFWVLCQCTYVVKHTMTSAMTRASKCPGTESGMPHTHKGIACLSIVALAASALTSPSLQGACCSGSGGGKQTIMPLLSCACQMHALFEMYIYMLT